MKILKLIIQAALCVASYFLLSATIDLVAAGGIVAILGGIFLIPTTTGIILAGLIGSAKTLIKGALNSGAWWFLIAEFIIFCGYIIIVVLNFVL